MKQTRDFSKKQESDIAKALGGKRQPNSGATQFRKGDVILDRFLIECKTVTQNRQSFSIQKSVITKIDTERFAMGKLYWSVAFNFGPGLPNYYIVDESIMKYLIKKLKEEDG